MNNWLGFSLLSPQENPSPSHDHHHHHHHQISGGCTDVSSGDCFDPTDHASFGALEALRNTHSHDWNVKGLGEVNMMMGGTSSCNTAQNQEDPPPKLENFLGVGGRGGGSYMFQGRPLMMQVLLPSSSDAITTATTTANERAASSTDRSSSSTAEGDDNMIISNSTTTTTTNNNIISNSNLSVMKSWLRNQQLQESKSNVMNNNNISSTTTTPISAVPPPQGLSLSINGQQQYQHGFSSDHHNIIHDHHQHHENVVISSSSSSSSAGLDQVGAAIEAIPRKTIDTFGQRTSIYRGVTRHRWTGRYEAHLWDNSCRREGQTRKGRQVYLGGYDKEEKAARAYDLAALKYWGTTTTTNFPMGTYEKEVEEMKHMTRQEYVASLRRKSSGFSRGASIYRGVTRHHQHGRWQARIGRVAGNKDLYLGTFSTQEEAAEAYDIAAIKFRGLNAVTNFDMSRYDVKSILESSTLPIGGSASKRFKDVDRDDTPDAVHLLGMVDGSYGQGHGGGWSNNATPSLFQQQHPVLQGMHYPTRERQVWSRQEVDAANGMIPGHQLHLGTHDFFHTSSGSVLHNLMSVDSSSNMENSSGSTSNSTFYGGAGVEVAYGSNHNIHIPLAAVNNSNGGGGSYGGDGEVSLAASDGYDSYHQHQARSMMGMYYHQSPVGGGGKVSAGSLSEQHHQGSTCNSGWLPAVLASRHATMAVCPAPPTAFNTVWNDT